MNPATPSDQVAPCEHKPLFSPFPGSPFDPRTPIFKAVSNIICNFVFGHRFSEEDAHFNKLLKAVHMIVYVSGNVWGRVSAVSLVTPLWMSLSWSWPNSGLARPGAIVTI